MYQRFLNDRDYLAIITQDLLDQLVRDVHDRIPQAEQSAEMDMREYLDQYYEIEKALEVGKSIKEYSCMINYPPGVYFVRDDIIYRTLSSIRGRKKPTKDTYWEKITDLSLIRGADIDTIPGYYQTKTYYSGDIVVYCSEYWRCTIPNGIDFGNIQIPGLRAWDIVQYEQWQQLVEYELHDVVKYKGAFYTLTKIDDNLDFSMNPHQSDYWGMIGEYDPDYKYDCSEDAYDYVIFDNIVFKPVIDPNAEELSINVNVVRDDPRNLNVIKHMTRIALYYLHQTISPTNISETRRLMYEDSMNWLLLASKFKLNPQIPRKKDKNGENKVDWAMATFQREMDSLDNPWMI